MRKIVTEDQERIGAWVAEQTGRSEPWGKFGAIGVEDEAGELIAGAIYTDVVPGARCVMHGAGVGKNWMSKRFLWMCFAYPYYQLGVKVIVNLVTSGNKESLKFTQHFGFTRKCTIEDGAGDQDLIIFTQHVNDCKWLGVRHV